MIRWGIIGTGFIANEFAKDFENAKSGKLMAVSSRSLKKANKFANRYNIKMRFDSYEKLASSKDIDVVYVATPNTMHFENAYMLLKNNKHVLCEKPVTINQKELKKLIELAKKKDLLFMEGMWSLFQPGIVQAKKWIDNNEIGHIKTLKAEFGFKAEFNPENRLFNLKLGGGSLLDIGIYPIALATYIFKSMPNDLNTMSYIGKTGVDEQLHINLKYEKDQIATLSSSLLTKYNDDAFIYGTDGYIHIPNFWHSKKAILVKGNKRIEYNTPTKVHGYAYEVDHINKLLKNSIKESPIISYNHSLISMKIMDNVRKDINLKYPFE
ncbi:MAG: Gfo/Idh/MocA family protein [Bacillota bacterium]